MRGENHWKSSGGNLIEEELILNVIVVDETLYISRRYGVPYSDTFEFLRRVVLPFVEIVPLDAEDLYAAEKYLVNYGFKPSDAFHIATMEKAGATLIVSEDKDFDKVAWIKRVWHKSLSPKES